ncbi:MAG: type II toxin-antitoxin system PemK/MazF family toxin [Gaiellaceae bacterium]
MRRGDVYAIPPLRDTRGYEQAGRRYGVIVQASYLGISTTTIVAPTSTSAPARTFRPEVEIAGRQTRVLTDQLRTVDGSRLRRRAGRLAATDMNAVDDALKLVLGLL